MKKLLPIIIILLILLGVGFYFIMSKKQSNTSVNNTVVTNQPTTAAMTKNSLLDLIAQGKNEKCSFTTTTNGIESSGTFYISGKKMRGDFTTTVEGKKNSGSIIRDEDFTYIWGMSMAQGIKMKTSSQETSAANDQTKQYYNPSAKVDYKCDSWSPDNALLTPPSDIKFSEFTLPATQVTGTSGTSATGSQGNQAACAACNSLSGQAKTMCLTQLKCQ